MTRPPPDGKGTPWQMENLAIPPDFNHIARSAGSQNILRFFDNRFWPVLSRWGWMGDAHARRRGLEERLGMAITVSTEVKAMFEAEAKAVCEQLNAKFQQYNQEMNAITTFRCLKRVDAKWPVLEDDGENDEAEVKASIVQNRHKKLEVLHKGGNASANRQSISGETAKKGATATDIAASLLEIE